VLAPDGTEAVPEQPPSSSTVTLTVGLPLESNISIALIFLIIIVSYPPDAGLSHITAAKYPGLTLPPAIFET